MKRHAMIVAAGLFASVSALAQTETTGQAGPKPATAAGTVPANANPAHSAAPKAVTSAPASTAEGRSAAALALTHEPIYDEGSAQRIKDAALSYSDMAVRGGWPTILADAKFTLGVQGASDELLRKRLIVSGDLGTDGNDDAAHDRGDERVGAETYSAAGSFARAARQHEFRLRPALCRGQHPRGLCRGDRERFGGAALSRDRRQNGKTLADPDGADQQRRPQPDLDSAVLDRQDRNLGTYAQGSDLPVAHAHGCARRPRQSDRSAFGRLVGHAHAKFHRAAAERQLQRAWRGQDRHAEPLFGLHARHQPAQSVQRRLPLRFPRQLARRQRARSRRLAVEGPAEVEPRRNRRRNCHRAASGGGDGQEGAGGLDLPHGVDDQGPNGPVPQRRL